MATPFIFHDVYVLHLFEGWAAEVEGGDDAVGFCTAEGDARGAVGAPTAAPTAAATVVVTGAANFAFANQPRSSASVHFNCRAVANGSGPIGGALPRGARTRPAVGRGGGLASHRRLASAASQKPGNPKTRACACEALLPRGP